VGLRLEPDWPVRRGVDLADRTQVRTFLRSRFEGWAPVLVDALVTSESYVNRPVWVLPDALTWEHVPGVTLVGDAAHVMAPFGGWGVNHALLDGVELAAAVVGPGRREGSLDERVAAYERAMFARTGPLSGQANGALQEFFSAAPGDAPDHRAEHEAYEEAAAALRRERAGASA
jgi:2-polyprenyl-6-methoxyphenol hydroxylase-like FAD-dependent oxidoreductase